MSEKTAQDPVQQEATPSPEQQSQAAPGSTAPEKPQSPPEGYVEQARFTGAIRKIEQLTTQLRELQAQLEQKTSEIERLQAQLAEKDVEKQVAVGERDKMLEERVKENQELLRELEQLRAFRMKVETAKKLGHPELINLIHTIPDMQDAEALESVMQDFVRFTEAQVKAREQQLLAGITPPVAAVDNAPERPSTNEGWERYVNSFPPGSPERQRAFDEWYEWLSQRE